MPEQRRLDLDRPDPVAGADDHVVGARLEEQPAVLVRRAPDRRCATARPAAGVAVVAEEERRDGRRVDAQLAVDDLERRTPGSGRPIDPGGAVSPGGTPVRWPGLGLPVAVGDRQPGLRRATPRAPGTPSASPAVTSRRNDGTSRDRAVRGDQPVLRRRHAQHVDVLGADRLQPLGRVEAAVLQQRRRAAQPRREEGSCAPTSTTPAPRSTRPARPARRPSTCRAWSCWPVHVALPVRHQLRLAARPGREQHERRIELVELGVRRRRRRRGRRGTVSTAQPGSASSTTARLRVGAHHERRTRAPQPQGDVLGAQLLAARQHRRAELQAGEHRQRVLDACCRRA